MRNEETKNRECKKTQQLTCIRLVQRVQEQWKVTKCGMCAKLLWLNKRYIDEVPALSDATPV